MAWKLGVALVVGLGMGWGCRMPPPPEAAPTGLPAVPVRITSEPSGAAITVDGELLGATPASVRLTPGSHRLRLSLSGYLPVQSELTVAGKSGSFHGELVTAH